MTGPQDSSGTRPISVAELLARNGSIGAPPPVAGRRRRRRGNADAVTVAELTGEIPVIGAAAEDAETPHRGPGTHARRANRTAANDATLAEDAVDEAPRWSEPEPRWPESPRQQPGASRPERSPFPLPLRRSARVDTDRADRSEAQPGAEGMSPDPLEGYAGIPVDVMDTEVREAVPPTEDSAYVRSYLGPSAGLFFGGKTAAEDRKADADENVVPGHITDDVTDIADAAAYPDLATDVDGHPLPSRAETILRGGLVVVQSILAVAFGAGLFIAFDQLWRWNNIVALVLSVLVILGLVVAVRLVRSTEDIVSTLIAVAVGAFVTLGPLALLQSG